MFPHNHEVQTFALPQRTHLDAGRNKKAPIFECLPRGQGKGPSVVLPRHHMVTQPIEIEYASVAKYCQLLKLNFKARWGIPLWPVCQRLDGQNSEPCVNPDIKVSCINALLRARVLHNNQLEAQD